MNLGKTLFAQVMDFLPWKTFHRLVGRYGADHRVRSLSCADQFRVMAFAQLTYRESLRDIEVCLSAQAGKLYHMGLPARVARATLADANERRDWRLFADFAQRLITRARSLYATERFGVDLEHTVYALDSTTIDLCLTTFPWAPFQRSKAAIKLHTLLDLRGPVPSFIHISDGRWHDVNVLDLLLPEPGAFYVMDRGYTDYSRLYALDQAGSYFVIRARNNMDARRLYSAPNDREHGVICDQTITFNGTRAAADYPAQLPRLPHQSPAAAGSDRERALSQPMAGGTILQVDQAASAHQALLRHLGERREVADLDRGLRLCADRDHPQGTGPAGLPAHPATDSLADNVRKNTAATSACRHGGRRNSRPRLQPVESIQLLTGQQ